jgi:hypothetical protein
MLIHRHITGRSVAVRGSAYCIRAKRITKLLVDIEGNDRLGELVQIAPQHISRVVDSIARPVKALAIAIWRVEDRL